MSANDYAVFLAIFWYLFTVGACCLYCLFCEDGERFPDEDEDHFPEEPIQLTVFRTDAGGNREQSSTSLAVFALITTRRSEYICI